MSSTPVPNRLAAAQIVGEAAGEGVTRYDLENLLPDTFQERQQIKVHLFCHQDRTTLRIGQRTEKKVDGLQYPLRRWEHTASYTISVKRNRDGRATFNLYSHSKKRGLLNLTSRPELVFRGLPEPLKALMLEEAQRLFEQNIRPWRVPDVQLEMASDILLYNTYPAYFQYAGNIAKDRRTFHNQLPSAIYPLLRQEDPARVVEQLFGDDVPARLYAEFEAGAPAQLYTAALLFGKLVPAATFLDVDWHNTTIDFPLVAVPMIRKVLNRCDPASITLLYRDYIRLTAVGATAAMSELAKLLTDTGKKYARDIPYRQLQTITEVATIAELTTNLAAQCERLLDTAKATQKRTFDTFAEAFRDLFDTGNPPYGFIVYDDAIKMAYKRGDAQYQIVLFRAGENFKPEVRFSARLFGKRAPLPATHVLQKTLKSIVNYNPRIIDDEPILDVQDAVNYLQSLVASLRRIAIRHSIPTTKQNITRLLYYYLYYYDRFSTHNSRHQKLKPPPLPRHFQAYVLDNDLASDEVRLFGLIWDVPLATMHTWANLPMSVYRDFANVSPPRHAAPGRDVF